VATDQELLIRINASAKGFQDELTKAQKKTAALQRSLVKAAKISAIAFTALASAIGLVTREFAKFETGLVGVAKTTNLTGKELDKFGDEIIDLSKSIPVASTELLGIAQTAGQLGVEGADNLIKFTDVVARLGFATNLTGEEAATALTRIINITGESIDNIDKLASSLVGLGNTSAATESEIIRVATEVARSTAQFRLSSAEVLGVSTALKALGIQAQLGGSVVGRAFREIDAAIRGGGKELRQLAKLTGIAGDDLGRTFSEDKILVFQKFVEGLGAVEKSGGSVAEALSLLGLRGDEINKVLPVLATRADLLGQKLATANEEFEKNNALTRESDAAFNTLNSDFQRLTNAISAAAIALGTELAPSVEELLKFITSLTNDISELDKETIKSIATFLKYATVFAGVTAAILTVGAVVVPIIAVLGTVAAAVGTSVAAVAGGIVALSAAITGLTFSGGAQFFKDLFTGGNKFAKFTDNELNVTLEETRRKLEELAIASKKALRFSTAAAGIERERRLAQEQIKLIESVVRARQEAEETAFGAPRGELGDIPTLGGGQGRDVGADPEVKFEKDKQTELARIEKEGLARRREIREAELELLKESGEKGNTIATELAY